MKIVNCDKCGEQANGMFCNPEKGVSENSIPCGIEFNQGQDETNCRDFMPEKSISYDLCRNCFEQLSSSIFLKEEKND